MRLNPQFILFAVIVLGLGSPATAEVTSQKPNIIFVLADDLGIGGLSCYGPDVLSNLFKWVMNKDFTNDD